PPSLAVGEAPKMRAAVVGWLAELERTVSEWRDDHPEFGVAAGAWPAVLSGGGALQPGLVQELRGLSSRPVEPWPEGGELGVRADQATAWGGLLLGLGLAFPAPSLLPAETKAYWTQQRLWRGLLSFNLVLAMLLAVAIGLGMREQGRRLSEKRLWTEAASSALEHARNIRGVAEAYNARLDAVRPILERQRQTVETLQVLSVLQQQRTNAQYWYVLLADGASYAAGSNDVAGLASAPRPGETRPAAAGAATPPTTNAPVSVRSFVAEVCLVPQGEDMRRALSELVGDLKHYALFRNVDVLPVERRREWVATNLIFPERHFALELNLSEAELLPSVPLPKSPPTNREPSRAWRGPGRFDASSATNGGGRVMRPR
ncbi:MAG: hypothetical protein JNL97_09025, partial [Verrucomicrobiales bacterium]|nr:hypothetical protein [Verrucomicrobiales bacterium]